MHLLCMISFLFGSPSLPNIMKTIIIMLMLASLSAMATEVQLTKQSGVYSVPVRINDKITLDFVLDSGAGDVQMPRDVIRTLIRTGTISEADFLESKEYTQADGSTVTNERLLIKRLQVGDTVINNVTVSVGGNNGALLLGQSFLARFSSWSIDNSKQSLVLGDQQNVQQQTAYATTNTIEEKKSFVTWYKDNEYGMRMVATDIACDDAGLVERGYQFNIASSIPVDRLKNKDDAYLVNDTHAFTVKGCWSPKMHKVSWHRKHDNKEWEQDFKIDDTWVKTDDSAQNDKPAKVDTAKNIDISIKNDVIEFEGRQWEMSELIEGKGILYKEKGYPNDDESGIVQRLIVSGEGIALFDYFIGCTSQTWNLYGVSYYDKDKKFIRSQSFEVNRHRFDRESPNFAKAAIASCLWAK